MSRIALIVVLSMLLAPSVRAQDKQADEASQLRKEIKEVIEVLKARDKAFQEATRMQQELVKTLAALVAEREKAIVQLQQDKEAALREAVAARQEAAALRARADAMEAVVRDLQRRLALLDAGALPPKARDAADLNPPDIAMKGKITRMDERDPSLVVINLGADAGLKVNHTLQAFRLKPEPRFLGVVRIMEVMPHQAIGRIDLKGRKVTLEIGDEVTSRLDR